MRRTAEELVRGEKKERGREAALVVVMVKGVLDSDLERRRSMLRRRRKEVAGCWRW